MSSSRITPSRVVSLHYRLEDRQGRTLDDSRARQQPLEYLHGHDNLFAALEQAMADHAPGDQLSVTLPPEDAYGKRDEALLQETPRSAFADGEPLKPGQRFQAQGPEGPRTVTLEAVGDTQVTVDANHPLAGETLTYAIDILEVREATLAELTKGHPLPPETRDKAPDGRG